MRGYGWTALPRPDKYTGLWRGLDITRSTPVLALTNSSLDHDSDAGGNVNQAYQWTDVKDQADLFQVRITGSHKDATFDLTPRRLGRFQVKPARKLRWQATSTPARRNTPAPPPQSGTVVVDKDGLFTLRGLKSLAHCVLTVTVTRAR